MSTKDRQQPLRWQGSGGGALGDHRAPVGRLALLHCCPRLAGHGDKSRSGGGSGDGALRWRKRLVKGCHTSSGRRRWCCSWLVRGCGRSRQQQVLLAGHGHGAKVTSAAGRARGSRGRAPGRLRNLQEGSGILFVSDRGAGQLSTKVESRVLHGSHVLATRRPLKHFDEQVVGNRLTSVGDKFGPFPCRIRRWAKNKVCCPRGALRFLFKGYGH